MPLTDKCGRICVEVEFLGNKTDRKLNAFLKGVEAERQFTEDINDKTL